MTVQELIEKLTKLGRPDAEVTTEYHLHDYIRTIEAVPVRGVYSESVYFRAGDKQMVIPQDDDQIARRRDDSEWRDVVIIR